MKSTIIKRICMVLPLAAVLSASMVSCSIKEDRWPCPCYLIFKPGEGVDLNAPGGFTATVSNGAGKELSADISWRQIRDDDYTVAVSKGEKEVNILAGRHDNYMQGNNLLVVKGHQTDSIYSSVHHVSCLGETAEVPVDMLKQFSTVFLSLEDGGKDYPYFIRVKGAVDGLNLSTLEPTQGEYYFEPKAANALHSQYEFRLPRQFKEHPEELTLEIWVAAANRQEQDRLVDRLPLGSLILDAHHDWEKPSLEDIWIGVDYAQAVTKINVNDWITDWTGSFEI